MLETGYVNEELIKKKTQREAISFRPFSRPLMLLRRWPRVAVCGLLVESARLR